MGEVFFLIIVIIVIFGGLYRFTNVNYSKSIKKINFFKEKNGNNTLEQDLKKYHYLINKKSFLNSKNENHFLLRLNEYIKDKDFIAYPKVRIGDIIDVKSTSKGFRPYSITSRIDRSHVDFVLIRKSNFTIFCAIELDDTSHFSEEAKVRDNAKDILFEFVKIPLLRFHNTNPTDEEFAEKGL